MKLHTLVLTDGSRRQLCPVLVFGRACGEFSPTHARYSAKDNTPRVFFLNKKFKRIFRCIFCHVGQSLNYLVCLPMDQPYIPKVGDRVQAHSKGRADSDHAVVYTDWQWFNGTIIKVK